MGSPFLDRLRRLGVAPDGRVAPAGGPAPSPAVAVATSVTEAGAPPVPGLQREGPSWVLTRRVSVHARHGDAPLNPVAGLSAWAAAASRDARFHDIPLDAWRFVDTETTSLHGGAGVWVFLVGIGRYVDGAFVVRQHLLAGPHLESDFLDAVRREIEDGRALVSFHGKSFDAPRIDDRFRLQGLEAVCRGRPHLDLIHPVRRHARNIWGDVRLRTVEERWLGFHREDDLPGAECPAQYFAWQRGGRHRLAEVFLHNHLDIVSLAALARRLLPVYGGAADIGCPIAAGMDRFDGGDAPGGLALMRAARSDARVHRPLWVRACRAALASGDLDLGRRLFRQLEADHPLDAGVAALGRRIDRLTARISQVPTRRQLAKERPKPHT